MNNHTPGFHISELGKTLSPFFGSDARNYRNRDSFVRIKYDARRNRPVLMSIDLHNPFDRSIALDEIAQLREHAALIQARIDLLLQTLNARAAESSGVMPPELDGVKPLPLDSPSPDLAHHFPLDPRPLDSTVPSLTLLEQIEQLQAASTVIHARIRDLDLRIRRALGDTV